MLLSYFGKGEKKLKEKERNELLPFLSKISKFNESLEDFKSQEKYLSNYELCNFQKEHKDLYHNIKSKKFKYLKKLETPLKEINSFKNIYENLIPIIESRNNAFIKKELKNTNELLSDIEGKSLDTQQREAILIDEDNQLVIAGAGSGKTITIAGKVKYLTYNQNIETSIYFINIIL